jgi:hypothetical protein
VRINIPFIPISAEFRLRPLRPFQFTVRGLMLATVVASLFFSLFDYAARLHTVGSFHTEEMVKVASSRPTGPPFGTSSLVNWHATMSLRYHHSATRIDSILIVMLMTFVSIVMVIVIGRVLNWLLLRSVVPAQDCACPLVSRSTTSSSASGIGDSGIGDRRS